MCETYRTHSVVLFIRHAIASRSFAYYTISERLPVILTQVVDQLSKDKDVIVAAIGTEVCPHTNVIMIMCVLIDKRNTITVGSMITTQL